MCSRREAGPARRGNDEFETEALSVFFVLLSRERGTCLRGPRVESSRIMDTEDGDIDWDALDEAINQVCEDACNHTHSHFTSEVCICLAK